MAVKTLVGKKNVLFLINDSSNEIEKHVNTEIKGGNIQIINIYKSFENFFLFVYPDKSIIYQEFLSDDFSNKKLHRNIFNDYKHHLGDHCVDLLHDLKSETDVYYKTDTHINLKGGYIVYNFFVKFLKLKLNINIPKLEITNLSMKKVSNLSSLHQGIGDLTWNFNKCDVILTDITDNFYYDEVNELKYYSTIPKNSSIRLLEYNTLLDITEKYENCIFGWEIASDYILYSKNSSNDLKVLVFYDSFLLQSIYLYYHLFKEIYFIKSCFLIEYINLIKPDFIFEFRIERFLF